MKHLDKDPLLNELLTGSEVNGFREASLEQGLAALRNVKRRRRFIRGGSAAGLTLVAVLLLLLSGWLPQEPSPALVATDSPRASAPKPVVEPFSVETIDDAELFALFPDRPLALVGSPGNQRLIFLDELVTN